MGVYIFLFVTLQNSNCVLKQVLCLELGLQRRGRQTRFSNLGVEEDVKQSVTQINMHLETVARKRGGFQGTLFLDYISKKEVPE